MLSIPTPARRPPPFCTTCSSALGTCGSTSAVAGPCTGVVAAPRANEGRPLSGCCSLAPSSTLPSRLVVVGASRAARRAGTGGSAQCRWSSAVRIAERLITELRSGPAAAPVDGQGLAPPRRRSRSALSRQLRLGSRGAAAACVCVWSRGCLLSRLARDGPPRRRAVCHARYSRVSACCHPHSVPVVVALSSLRASRVRALIVLLCLLLPLTLEARGSSQPQASARARSSHPAGPERCSAQAAQARWRARTG